MQHYGQEGQLIGRDHHRLEVELRVLLLCMDESTPYKHSIS